MNRTFKTAAQIFPNVAASIYGLNFTFQPIFEKTKQTGKWKWNWEQKPVIIYVPCTLCKLKSNSIFEYESISSFVRWCWRFRLKAYSLSLHLKNIIFCYILNLLQIRSSYSIEGKSGQPELFLEFIWEKKTFFFTKLSIS